MRRFSSLCLALVSTVLLRTAVDAARPHYGGTLRVDIDATIRSLAPTAIASDGAEASARRHLQPLVFEPLVTIAPAGGLQPALAIAWDRDDRNGTWRFRLRSGVRLHDGSVLEPWQVASALRAAEPEWKITNEGDAILISGDRAVPDVPWVLADGTHTVWARSAAGDTIGTGSFRIDRVEPNRLTLAAHDAYWGGRAFLDRLDVAMGRGLGAQQADLAAGRVDMIAVRPTDAARFTSSGASIASSKPIELVAMIFEPHRSVPAFEPVRKTLAVSVNRPAMCDVLLQKHADPADALLPVWLSGYRPLPASRPTSSPRPDARGVAGLPAADRELLLRADASDPLLQSIADRIVADARAAGFSMKAQAPVGLAPRPDARLARITLRATTPERVLAALVASLGPRTTAQAPAPPGPGAPLEAVYRAEMALLQAALIVPIVHLPETFAFGDRVGVWAEPVVLPSGAWDLRNVWIKGDPLRAGR